MNAGDHQPALPYTPLQQTFGVIMLVCRRSAESIKSKEMLSHYLIIKKRLF